MFRKTILTAFAISAMVAGLLLPERADCAEVSWTTSLNVRETWDSNPSITSTASNDKTADATGDTGADTAVDTKKNSVESDFVTYVSPQINLNSRGKNTNFRMGYIFSSSFYESRPELNAQQHRANLNLSYVPSKRTTISIRDTFRYTQSLTDNIEGIADTSQDPASDLQKPVDTSDTGIQTKREDVISNAVMLSVMRKMGQKVSAGITVSDSMLEYENQALIDSRTDSASLLLSYRATSQTSFTLTYGFSNIFYDLSGTNLNSTGTTAPADVDTATTAEDVSRKNNKNIGTHTATLGIEEHFSPSLTLSISGGSTYTPDMNDKYNWTANANIAKTFQFSSIVLGYSRVLVQSSGLTDQVSIYERVFLNLNLSVSKKVNLSANGSYSQNKSEGSSILVDSITETAVVAETGTEVIDTASTTDLISRQLDTESYRAVVRATFRPLQWLSLFLGYTHYEQISGDSLTSNITREQATIGFTATYGPNRY